MSPALTAEVAAGRKDCTIPAFFGAVETRKVGSGTDDPAAIESSSGVTFERGALALVIVQPRGQSGFSRVHRRVFGRKTCRQIRVR